MPQIHQRIQHNSGIPLGGIGTGSVEIRPDGLFHEWHVFNVGQWNPNLPCDFAEPMHPEDLVFMVRTKDSSGRVLARYLALREQLHDLYCLAWLRSISAINYDGSFPVAVLDYEDAELPVKIQAELFSVFIPLDSRASGTPGFYLRFSVRNLTDAPVEVSILGVMKNPVGWDQENRLTRNKLIETSGTKIIYMGADNLEPGRFSTGDMAFACTGGEITHITGSFRLEHRALAFHRSRYGLKVTTFMHQFHDDGVLPNLNAETAPLPKADFDASKLTASERERMLGELLQCPALYDKYHRIALIDPELVESPEFLNELVDNLAEMHERGGEWGWGALCSRITLAPHAENEALFVVAWYFPNHISPTGANIGHMYEHWFNSSLEVAQFLLGNYGELRDAVFTFADSIRYSSLPDEAKDAVTSQLTTLVKCTWWTRDGNFGVWEGYGCCGFHTTDITYQGSFPIISLFSDLQKAQMIHGAKFQREDGRVHHFFTPDFSSVDDGFDRVDMNPQFVMLAARDYLWTGDKEYLQGLWPHIIRAMENIANLDSDGDGLPDTDTRRNTYDCWDFTGCPSYIASLWLGALKVAVRLAQEMNDSGRAQLWKSLYEKGVAAFEEKLWNGEYYVLWRDRGEVDECCMSDQMSGEWFASTCGWGPILRPARIRKA
ncbi:MAG: GH116 family glycosyl hydrolase, partial [Armatimonadota bacterium]|nr:GH116 family glycosyl hydrolase [Armatimonadota bacterium]